MPIKSLYLCALLLLGFLQSHVFSEPLKPRVIILTDINESFEPDDTQSVIRALAYADQVEIEGLIATSGWNVRGEPQVELLPPLVNAYADDLENLMARSGQEGFLEDETGQRVGYWPSPGFLMERIALGQNGVRRENDLRNVGPDRDSAGSDLIIDVVDREDSRPVWILLWGGPNTLVQAINKVRRTRSDAEYERFIAKMRIHAIEDQDSAINQDVPEDDPYNSGQWIRREIPDLMYIWNHVQFRKFAEDSKNEEWEPFYSTHIQGQATLGSYYPDHVFGVEGDTPSLFHVFPLGLTDPERPDWGGWGGFFRFGASRQDGTMSWTDDLAEDDGVRAAGRRTMDLWLADTWHDFAARMEWAAEGEGSVNPVATVNGDATKRILRKTVKAGETIKLDASDSYDPDGTDLTYLWEYYQEAGNYAGDVDLGESGRPQITIDIPDDFGDGDTIHLVLTVRDGTRWRLPAYRRVLLVPPGFDNWQGAHFSEGDRAIPEVGGQLGDPTGEGLSNWMRYAFGLAPDEPGRGSLPQAIVTEVAGKDYASFRYFRSEGVSDLEFQVEYSTDLKRWLPGSDPFFIRADPKATDKHGVVQENVRVMIPMEDLPNLFLRLEIRKER